MLLCFHFQITSDKLLAAVDAYKFTLAVYGHEALPDFSSPVDFQDRIDSLLVLMARSCPELSVLVSFVINYWA